MEPLFKTQTVHTYEEYKRWNLSLNKSRFIVMAVLLILLLFIILLYSRFLLLNASTLILLVFLTAICAAVSAAGVTKTLKASYYSNKALQKCPVIQIEFYDHFFESKNERHYSKYFYEDIYKIVETKTNFYIMTAINSGTIVVKQNCAPELIVFIQGLKNNNK